MSINLRPSWIFAAILALAHGGAIAMVALAGASWWLELMLIAALLVSLVFNVRRAAMLRTPGAVSALAIAADDKLSIQTRCGEWIECEVLGSTYVTYFLTILNLKRVDNGKTARAVLLPDSVDAEVFRKLRVWLRWKREPQPG